jgi:hypothetical protein
MPIQTKTLAVLLTEIKKEARISGSDNLDTWLTSLINELLLDYVEKTRYFEMLLVGQPITLVDETSAYDLPADFHKMRGVRYTIGSGNPYPIYPRGEYVQTARNGNPKFYELAGDQILITPITNIRATDTLVMDYYKYPSELVDPGDVFPIPRLIGPLKLKAITRAVIYNRDLNVAAALRGESIEQETRSSVPKGQG